MEKPGGLNFEVGQLAELKTFEHGYRGAWFRCKIKDIQLKKNNVWLEYYDFDSEELSWEEIYQVPPYMRKTKFIKKQLMVRPQYPLMYRKSEMPAVISQPCVINDGTWKVGDLVDWFEQGCFWSARIIKVLSDDKVQIELPMPPLGEGKEGEEGRYEALCNDLRPSLDWSETEGWKLLTLEGHASCDTQLIFPTNQGEGMDLEAGHEHENAHAAAGSTTHVLGEKDGVNEENEVSVEMDYDVMESSESISSLKRKEVADEVAVAVEKSQLNIMREHTLEAAVLDLVGLRNKVKWMQGLLKSPTNDDDATWKIA